MKKFFFIGIGTILMIFLIIQLIPHSLPENSPQNSKDSLKMELATMEVTNILKNSCFDCHSNQTVYPWYAHIAPVSWLVAHDVSEAREALNFSIWNSYNKRRMIRKLGDIKEQVEKEKMPIPIYTCIHRHTKLNVQQIAAISNWSDTLITQIIGR